MQWFIESHFERQRINAIYFTSSGKMQLSKISNYVGENYIHTYSLEYF